MSEKRLSDAFAEAFVRLCNSPMPYQEMVEASHEAVATEGIKRWLASLPPGPEGLYEVFKTAWFITDGGPFIKRVKRGIAAVLEVQRRRQLGSEGDSPSLEAIVERVTQHDNRLYQREIKRLKAELAEAKCDAHCSAQRGSEKLRAECERLTKEVERLMAGTSLVSLQSWIDVASEQKNEIDRLRAEANRESSPPSEVLDYGGVLLDEAVERRAEVARWTKENERLKAELAEAKCDAHCSAQRGSPKWRAEIERLTKELETARNLPPGVFSPPPGIAVVDADHYAAMEAEVERLTKERDDAIKGTVHGWTCMINDLPATPSETKLKSENERLTKELAEANRESSPPESLVLAIHHAITSHDRRKGVEHKIATAVLNYFKKLGWLPAEPFVFGICMLCNNKADGECRKVHDQWYHVECLAELIRSTSQEHKDIGDVEVEGLPVKNWVKRCHKAEGRLQEAGAEVDRLRDQCDTARRQFEHVRRDACNVLARIDVGLRGGEIDEGNKE